jgi:methyl-accepting chemotaxis protein
MNTSSATEEQIKKLIEEMGELKEQVRAQKEEMGELKEQVCAQKEEMGELKEQVRAQKEEIDRLSKIIGNGKIKTQLDYRYGSSEYPVMLPETLTRYIDDMIIKINDINYCMDDIIRH